MSYQTAIGVQIGYAWADSNTDTQTRKSSRKRSKPLTLPRRDFEPTPYFPTHVQFSPLQIQKYPYLMSVKGTHSCSFVCRSHRISKGRGGGGIEGWVKRGGVRILTLPLKMTILFSLVYKMFHFIKLISTHRTGLLEIFSHSSNKVIQLSVGWITDNLIYFYLVNIYIC